MTTPKTSGGAIRQHLSQALPDLPVYRDAAPDSPPIPVAIIHDNLSVSTQDLGNDGMVLSEQVQVDLYTSVEDGYELPDALHSALHKAQIALPGSQVHRVAVTARTIDREASEDNEVVRTIFTLTVTRRIDQTNGTVMVQPVLPSALNAHIAATTDVHGIPDTSTLETQAGSQARANSALEAAVSHADAGDAQTLADALTGAQTAAQGVLEASLAHADAVAGETLISAQSYADAGDEATLTAAKAYTDESIGGLDLSGAVAEAVATAGTYSDTQDALNLAAAKTYTDESLSGVDLSGAVAEAKAYTDEQIADLDLSAAVAEANAYTDAGIAGVDLAGTQAAAVAEANAYTDEQIATLDLSAAVAEAEAYTDSQVALLVPASEKAAANGVATLGADGLVPNSQLPPLAITDTHVVATQAAMLALTAQVGDVAVRSDLSKSFILKASPASTLANWQELLTPPNAVISVDGRTGSISLTDLYDPLGAASTGEATAKSYADTQDAAHLAATDPHGDRAYAAAQDAATLVSGKTYSDTGDATTLASAKSYADTKDSAHVSAADPHGDRAYAAAQDSAHNASTTGVHGIGDTAMLALRNAANDFVAPDAAAIPITITLAAGQTANGFLVRTSTGTALLSLAPSGFLSASGIGASGGLRVGTSVTYSSGQRWVSIQDAASVPSSNPTGGVIVYVESGVLKMREPSGRVMPFAPTRQTTAVTTASLAVNAEWTGTVSLQKGYRLIALTTDKAARVRVYSTAAGRTADASRGAGYLPADGIGCVLDYLTTATNLGGPLSPAATGANLEASPSANIPIAIQNLSGSTGTVTATLTWVPVEF